MKYRLFRSVPGGGDRGAEELYRWHIEERSGHRMRAGVATDRWKKTTDDYLASAHALLHGMWERGYDGDPIPVDPSGELLDGSHRVACAIALGIGAVPVSHETRHVWAPEWGLRWFTDRHMAWPDLVRLQKDFEVMRG